MTRQLFDSGNGHFKSTKPKCHTTHPVLQLGNGEIVGASCGSPREGFDIYIGLCYTMTFQHQKYPWEHEGNDPIVEFQYRITDGCAPKKPAEFKKLIAWVAEQLEAGKRVHVGCIGGHGRTGTFLAALVAHMKGTEDAISWVRKYHCKKAVESKSQVNFLHKHFGVKKRTGSKEFSGTQTGRISGPGPYSPNITDAGHSGRYRKPRQDKVVPLKGERISHMDGKGSIWG